MTATTEGNALRTIGASAAIPNDLAVPYYLDELKRRIAVARIQDRLYAFDDLCTCAEPACPLSAGLLTGTALMCQCHGSLFDVVTGKVMRGPATDPLNVYYVQEVDGDVQIRL